MPANKIIIPLLTIAAFLASCSGNLVQPPKASRGNAHFSNYIAIGSTETSGFADGALYLTGQQHSYPAYIAQQFGATSSVTFNQPLVNNDLGGGFYGDTLATRLILGYFHYAPCHSPLAFAIDSIPHYFDPMFVPIRKPGSVNLSGTSIIPAPGPLNNLGAPYLHATDLLDPNYYNKNIFYFRMFGQAAVSPLVQIKKSGPTFFTVWLGTQEILDYALAGGENAVIPSITTFQAALDSVLNALSADSTTGGVIANIPDFTDFPFFNTIAYNALPLDSQLARLMNLVNAQYGLQFTIGNNPFVIVDHAAPKGRRLLKSDEKVLLSLPLDSLKCDLQGSVYPMNPQYVLTTTELANIQQAVQNYNTVIANEAMTRNIPLVDLYSLYKSLKTGIQYNGQIFTNVLVTGYFFSLDGLNPSYQGNAIIANEFIKQINNRYKSSVPTLDPTSFNGPSFP